MLIAERIVQETNSDCFRIPSPEFRGISTAQLESLSDLVKRVLTACTVRDARSGEPVTWIASEEGGSEQRNRLTIGPRSNANLYHINDWVVMPKTKPFRCSYVELVASSEQVPKWFVSHWWGTPFLTHTMPLIRFHSSHRCAIGETDVYFWICTFANNQHDLRDLGGRVEDTPFYKAIMNPACMGTVVILDPDATPFQRIWCVLENYVSTELAPQKKDSHSHYYDLATLVPAKCDFRCLCIGSCSCNVPPRSHFQVGVLQLQQSDGMMQEVCEDNVHNVLKKGTIPQMWYEARNVDKLPKKGTIPHSVIVQGLSIDIETAEASIAKDKDAILRMISGVSDQELPPSGHVAYDRLNAKSRARFLGPKGRQHLLSSLEGIEESSPL